MKSKFFYFAVGALALSACTSEDVLEDVASNRNVIGFENVVNKHSRADLDNSTLTAFNVFGYDITKGGDIVVDFENTQVVKESGSWLYNEEPRYWMPGATYNFFAYSDDNKAIATNKFNWVKKENGELVSYANNPVAGCELALIDYTSDASNQSDLVFTSQTGVPGLDAGLNNPVAFQFKHILSKVQAVFATQFADVYDVEVTNIVIKDIHGTGSYTLSEGWYAVESSNGAYVNLQEANGVIKPTAQFSEGNKSITAYVIPYNYADKTEEVKMTFDVKITSKEEVVLNKTFEATFNPTWEAGYSYTYNVVLSGSSAKLDIITFTTVDNGVGSVENWNNSDPSQNPTFKY